MKNKELDEIDKQKYRLAEINREIERNKRRLVEKESELNVKKTEKEINIIKNNDENIFINEYNNIKNKDFFKSFWIISNIINSKEVYRNINTLYQLVPKKILDIYIWLDIINFNKDDSDEFDIKYSLNFTTKWKQISKLYYKNEFLIWKALLDEI